MKVLEIDQQENPTQYEGITNQQINIKYKEGIQIGQQLKPSNNEDIALKKLGKKIPHPYFQIENEDGV